MSSVYIRKMHAWKNGLRGIGEVMWWHLGHTFGFCFGPVFFE